MTIKSFVLAAGVVVSFWSVSSLAISVEQFANQAARYELLGRDINCAIERADYDGEHLSVKYRCESSKGHRSGYFHGRQLGPGRFHGHYQLQTAFQQFGGAMRIRFKAGDVVEVSARGQRRRLRLRDRSAMSARSVQVE